MPIYEYRCKNCGRDFEELVFGDQKPACPACGESKVERQFSAPALHVANPCKTSCPARDTCGMSHCCHSHNH
jgi:putative FmdB family regulatory protein